MYYGSMWKDYAVWQAAPWIAHRIGASNAYAVEYDNVSCGTPVALRMARDMLLAEDELRTMLIVAACRESYLLDYGNERSRFMFNFGDGAVAGLLVKDGGRNEILGCHGVTDGSFSLQVKVPSGGSVFPNGGYRFLDVADPAEMKDGLDRISLGNFVVLIDYNKHQSYGPTAVVQNLEPLADKWRAFGFAAVEVNGHDVAALRDVLTKVPVDPAKPTAVVCHTVKGKGVAFAENNMAWHHQNKVTAQDAERLLAALEAH